MKITIVFDRIRGEEKWLVHEAKKSGHTTELIDGRLLSFEITDREAKNRFGDVVLQRCISYYRSSFLTRILENFGAYVINSSKVSDICGNKLMCSMTLAKAGVPTPRTFVALSSDSVDQTAEQVGYPVVMKPFVGSWGRMISIARDPQILDTIVELRESIPNPVEHMYYLQEFVQRPPRDIRAIVAGEEIIATIYRHAPENEWRTNVARGATTTSFRPDKELKEIVHKAAHAVGGGILGVDVMESKDGYVVHEVNNTVEFKGAQAASKTKIAKKMIDFAIRSAKN
ncbi:MAG: lysine biosynthesis protein LysX [Nitrososphaerales archaeon]|jgi:[lysine-biosynthesis-protein LysW]--L-2-aminoadipate ligase